MNKTIICFIILNLCCLSSKAQEYAPNWPDEEPEIISALVSRTGLGVASIEKSLLFYQDILGLRVFYERKGLDDPRLVPFSGMKPGQTMNLVVLTMRLKDSETLLYNSGYIGLSEIREADGSLLELPPIVAEQAPMRGISTMLIMVKDVMEVYDKVIVAGYIVLSAPKKKENGKNTQLLMLGPDGERLWITESENVATFIDK